ncbi:MAG: fused MFS/spermidine synthase [Actinomycetota bacterium]|nr:fused MFS/spermidine synthase [Actinomycetota bacterium]
MGLALFTATLFVSSALLFLIQPMFAKMVLPLLGGSPATWVTCLLFFQAALLAGYAYAHWSTRWLGVRRQATVHAVLLAGAGLALPIAVPSSWSPPPTANPVPWLLGLLVVSVGLPFFLVSSTAPLLQRWFAGTRHAADHDPYHLYRASNLGSLIALLGYPALVEPRLRLSEQRALWAGGYLCLVALATACAMALWRSPLASATEPSGGLEQPPPTVRPGVLQRARWVALAFVPSTLMLGITTHITSDIAAVPLLWVVPLALYLLSFVVVFSPRPSLVLGLMGQLQPFLVLELVLLVVIGATQPVLLVVAVNLVVLLVSAVVCHGRLAEERPPSARLTEFYLWIALGGVLGGVFNAVVAPVVFDSVVEYPLAVVLACLLRPPEATAGDPARARRLDLLLPLGVAALALVSTLLARWAGLAPLATRVVAAAVGVAACAGLTRRPVRFGLAVGAVFLAGAVPLGDAGDTLYANRTFFGVLRVERDGERHVLVHGNTTHGAQSTAARRRLEPLTYYFPSGPIGQVFQTLPAATSTPEVAVVGLGTGTLACWGGAGQRWTFFEIDPAVERLARDPRLFTYLRDCPPSSHVVLGDARLSLAQAPDRRFGTIVVDAFNSDAIPVHLLTREALALYLDKLADGGIVAVHVTNRYLDLRSAVGGLAREAGLTALVRDDMRLGRAERAAGKSGSVWMVLARQPADLSSLAGDPRWVPPPAAAGSEVWTDDFSNILAAFKRG